MGDKADGNIENVDEMFESFVKKKLQQLGMKRAAAKSTDGGTMNDLELSIKMRLEKNMAQNSNKEPVEKDETVIENSVEEKTEIDRNDDRNSNLEFENGDDDGPPKPKKSKKEKKHKKKKKKKEKDTWEEKPDPPQEKESKSKKDKSHHKKEPSKNRKKEKKSEKDSKNSEAKDKSHNKERHSKGFGERDSEARDKTHNRDRHSKKEDKVSKESVKSSSEYVDNDASLGNKFPKQETATLDSLKSESTPPEIAITENDLYDSLKSEKSSKITRDVPESTTPTTSGPKKDIATIKMKIELLKAKSEGEKLQQEVDGLLRKAAQNHTSKVEEKQKSGRNSESKDADGKERKRRESSRDLSRSNSHRYSKSHSRHRSRSRSRSRERKRSSLLRRSRTPPKHSRRRSRSRSRDRHRSKRSRRNSRSPLISTEDKVRLLEIAKANALAQHRAGYAANLVSSLGQIVKEGSLSVRELTTLCEDIVTGKDEELPPGEPLTKESAEKMIKEAEASKIHHPFAVRDTPITFKLNQIKSVAIPPPVTKPLQILSKEFPVSCGQQHHRKEVLESVYGKWQVVAKDEATKKAVKELVTSEKVFAEPEPVNVSLSSAIADRISAVRQLQDNPTNKTAKDKMDAAQKALDSWTKSQKVPGQFTGHTGLTAMPRSVLEGGKQAWFKADDLRNAKHVTGIGKSLLQKMGWTPGQPLGKSMPGQLEPLQVDFKTDRRGLVSFMESPAAFIAKKAKSGAVPGGGPIAKDLSNKHPVSALMEICSKRHWAPPDFRLSDPLNLKMFTFRVFVCNDEYIGKPASNKKQAKLLAAQVALQNMGLIPKT